MSQQAIDPYIVSLEAQEISDRMYRPIDLKCKDSGDANIYCPLHGKRRSVRRMRCKLALEQNSTRHSCRGWRWWRWDEGLWQVLGKHQQRRAWHDKRPLLHCLPLCVQHLQWNNGKAGGKGLVLWMSGTQEGLLWDSHPGTWLGFCQWPLGCWVWCWPHLHKGFYAEDWREAVQHHDEEQSFWDQPSYCGCKKKDLAQ